MKLICTASFPDIDQVYSWQVETAEVVRPESDPGGAIEQAQPFPDQARFALRAPGRYAPPRLLASSPRTGGLHPAGIGVTGFIGSRSRGHAFRRSFCAITVRAAQAISSAAFRGWTEQVADSPAVYPAIVHPNALQMGPGSARPILRRPPTPKPPMMEAFSAVTAQPVRLAEASDQLAGRWA